VVEFSTQTRPEMKRGTGILTSIQDESELTTSQSAPGKKWTRWVAMGHAECRGTSRCSQ